MVCSGAIGKLAITRWDIGRWLAHKPSLSAAKWRRTITANKRRTTNYTACVWVANSGVMHKGIQENILYFICMRAEFLIHTFNFLLVIPGCFLFLLLLFIFPFNFPHLNFTSLKEVYLVFNVGEACEFFMKKFNQKFLFLCRPYGIEISQTQPCLFKWYLGHSIRFTRHLHFYSLNFLFC